MVQRPSDDLEVAHLSDVEVVAAMSELLSGAEVAGPNSPSAIVTAESALGVVLPRSYRLFLLHFGAAFAPGLRIAGIDPTYVNPDACPLHENVVRATRIARQTGRGNFPDGLVPISGDGCDAEYCIDTSAADRAEAPVIVWGPVADHEQELASSFLEFLRLASKAPVK